jgi:protein-L-isoaspartate(D-aspartate) O-methyltransferase
MLAIAQLQRLLWREMTDDGGVLSPSPRLEAAFFSAPRHQFIGRYRTWYNQRWRYGDLDEIYSDVSLILVGDDNHAVISSASQPSYVLSLVDALDIQPGHRVLEIGSGCGWLCAVMGHLAGPEGRVTGIEILPELAQQSRDNLAELRNITIHCGDGRDGFEPSAPYDRVICTAAMTDVSGELLAQTAPGARLMLPISTGDATRCAVRLFEQTGNELKRIGEREGFFVPLVAAAL